MFGTENLNSDFMFAFRIGNIEIIPSNRVSAKKVRNKYWNFIQIYRYMCEIVALCIYMLANIQPYHLWKFKFFSDLPALIFQFYVFVFVHTFISLKW